MSAKIEASITMKLEHILKKYFRHFLSFSLGYYGYPIIFCSYYANHCNYSLCKIQKSGRSWLVISRKNASFCRERRLLLLLRATYVFLGSICCHLTENSSTMHVCTFKYLSTYLTWISLDVITNAEVRIYRHFKGLQMKMSSIHIII